MNKLSLEPGFLGKLVSDMQRDGGEIEARCAGAAGIRELIAAALS